MTRLDSSGSAQVGHPDARTAIVTGAASGIGAATVLELARQGYRTVGIDINAAGAQAVAL